MGSVTAGSISKGLGGIRTTYFVLRAAIAILSVKTSVIYNARHRDRSAKRVSSLQLLGSVLGAEAAADGKQLDSLAATRTERLVQLAE